jgi:acetylornithine deacetylase/succinyl-diaminopimelate desuccinylase-like protein
MDVDIRKRSHGRLRLWLAISVALAALVLALGIRFISSDAPAAAKGNAYGLPAGVTAWVTERLVTTLEKSTPAEHAQHGHDLSAAEQTKPVVLCTVEPFGIDPPNATAPGAVKTVYAHHLCAVVEKGRPWDFAVKTAGPLVAQMLDPVRVKVVESGLGYPERIKQMIPAEYRERALVDFGDGGLVMRLRNRYQEAAK